MVLPSEVPATHWKTKYMNEFAEEVKKRTNGALVVKVFPASQLYNDQDALAALGTGAVHMVVASGGAPRDHRSAYGSCRWPSFPIFLPYPLRSCKRLKGIS